MSTIRASERRDVERMLAIINAAADAYRGAIPQECWHDPYMPHEELLNEIESGASFFVLERDGRMLGVMGIQRVANVELVRHAYVLPDAQGVGIGKQLLESIVAQADYPLLVGTWAAATWAVRFYERNGFQLAPESQRDALLHTYWDISARQVETSVVLARPALSSARASELIAAARIARPCVKHTRAVSSAADADRLRATQMHGPAPSRILTPRRVRRTRQP
jgi:GNAT superfamily N-acetyltransferase